MTSRMMYREGDAVILLVLNNALGTIAAINFDRNNDEIYTIKLKQEWLTPNGLYFARHNEIKPV